MDRADPKVTLTTSQVGELLSVHPSTIKRWCDGGDLGSDRTDGGHRRIRLGDVLHLARTRRIDTFLDPFSPFEGDVWDAVSEAVQGRPFRRAHTLALNWLQEGETARISWFFQELGRHPELDFGRFCDEGIRGFMERVGDEWRTGSLCAGQEHLASQAITEALLHLRAHGSVDRARTAPASTKDRTAVVGAMEGDQHHLGALCVRLLLERLGWTVHYLGPDVPVEDLATLQRSFGARLVCVSFSPPASAADMKRCVRILSEFYTPLHPYALVLGGGAEATLKELRALAPPFRGLGRFAGCREFTAALENGFAGSGPRGRSGPHRDGYPA